MGTPNKNPDALVYLLIDRHIQYIIPEHRLLAAMISSAVSDMELSEVTGYGSRERRRHILSACYWATRKDCEVGSFLWICETLGMDADRIKKIQELAWRNYRRLKGKQI